MYTVQATVDLTDLHNRVEILESRPTPQSQTPGVAYSTPAIRLSTETGAIGNGVVDDHAKIQALLDSMGQSGGGIFAILKHHAVSKSLVVWSNTQVIGTGKLSAHHNFAGTLAGNNCYLIRNKNWESNTLLDTNISVSGLEFDYRSLVLPGGGLHAVSMRKVRNATVKDAVFHGGEDATAFLGCDTTLVDNCKAYDFINCAFDHWVSPVNATVRGCTAETSNTVQMINFNPDNTFGSSIGEKATGFKMIGNHLKYTGPGAAPCQLEPLSAGCSVMDVQVSGNTFDNTYVVARGMVGNLSVDGGNIFRNITGGKNALLVQEQFNARPYYINVNGNIISGATTPAAAGGVITLKANAYICSNNIVDAPAAHVALYTVDGIGIRGINNFSVGTSGQRQIGT